MTGNNLVLHKALIPAPPPPPPTTYLLQQVQRDGSLWGDFDGLAPELELGVDAAGETEDVGLGVEGTNWGVVAHLFTHDLEAQVLPKASTHTHQVSSPTLRNVSRKTMV